MGRGYMYDPDTYKTYPFHRMVYRWEELSDVDCYSSTIDHFTRTVTVECDNINEVVEMVLGAVRLVRKNVSIDVACTEMGIRQPTEEELRFIKDLTDYDDDEVKEIIEEVISD
jgi:hypothetical protein